MYPDYYQLYLDTIVDTAEATGAFPGGTWHLSFGTLLVEGNIPEEFSQHLPEETRLSVTQLILDDGCTNIGIRGFQGLENLRYVVLPDGLRHIGDYAFSNCFRLENIQLPETLRTIGRRAFFLNGSLKSINLPEQLEHIGEMAFALCISLTDLAVPDAAYIAPDAFYHVPHITCRKPGTELWGADFRN